MTELNWCLSSYLATTVARHNGLSDFIDDIGTASEEQRELLSSVALTAEGETCPRAWGGGGVGLECELGTLPCPSPTLCPAVLHTSLFFTPH